MAVSREILRSYRAPRTVMRRLIDASGRDARPEARGFIYLLIGCLLIFLSQIPEIVRAPQTGLEDEAPLQARLAITGFAWLFIWPLGFYLLGGLLHLMARLFGGRGQGRDSRLALFWSLLVAAPLFFLRALAGLAGNDMAETAINALLALVFVIVLLFCLYEAHFGKAEI